MIPLCVTLEGFLSYQDAQRLEFDGSPLWVLAGPNGAGKSAIFDAITFALYDRHRAGGQNAGDLINHHRDHLVVEFDFLLDGIAYRVRRTARKRVRSVETTREAFRLLPSDARGPAHPEPIPDTTGDAGFRRWVQARIGLNYDAFTSSVLLLQGQSDKLIRPNTTTADRYKILAELIDLSAYQALHDRVDARRRTWEGQAKSLQTQLDSMSPVSDDELEAARAAVQEADDQWKALQSKSERLAALLEQAKQWEVLEQERARLQGELRAGAALLERAEGIEDGHARWQELSRMVPQLRNILDQRHRLEEQSSLAGKLRLAVAEGEEQLEEASAAALAARESAERLAAEIRNKQEKRTQAATRLAEIAPLVVRLEQFEELQSRLTENTNALALIPADLDEQLAQAQARERQLEEASRVLPWLKHLASARCHLSKARDEEHSAASQQAEAEAQMRRCQEDRRPAAAAADMSRGEAERLSHAVTRAQTSLDEIRGRRDRFETVGGEKTCSFCGQSIDERHARRERKYLADQVATGARELQDMETARQTAVEGLKQREGEIKALDQQIAVLEKEAREWEKRRAAARGDAQRWTDQLNSADHNLSASYRKRIAPEMPADEVGWVATSYPSAADLEALERKAGERPAASQCLSDLRYQQTQWNLLDAQRQQLLEQAAGIQTVLDIAAAQPAREEQKDLKLSSDALEEAASRLQKEHRQTIEAAERAEEAVKDREAENTRMGTEATKAQATCDEIGRVLKAALAELPQAWRENAASFGARELAQQEATLAQLAPYSDLARQLVAARLAKDALAKRIDELTTQTNALPEEAKCPAAAVEVDLGQARTERDEADATRRKAEQLRGDLDRRREQRQQCEAGRLHADRQRHLHDRLANLLGPRGLQLALLRRAERGIVNLANETLSAISRGRMELALRGGEGAADSLSDKALDLVVYNHDTGTHPMLAAMASGSQKFRIAVSLALAIGRYAGQEARRIESVIIDEGFGSLDKDGRADMIQELHQLKQHLQRIILVSHQEEFAGAFANGYAVKLSADGASRVSLLECG
jgi:DNA repair exonuclease SbcCD ATPase subunit